MFLIEKANVVGKLEATPYTQESLASADFNVRVRDLSYSAEIAEFRRKVLNGHLDMNESVMGKRQGAISFVIDLTPAADVGDEPQWSKLLQACGFKPIGWNAGGEVVVGSAVEGISWVPHVDFTHQPMTIEVIERNDSASPAQLVSTYVGCMGNVKFTIGTVGEPIQMMFELKGALVSMADRVFGSILAPTAQLTGVPAAFLSATATVGGVDQDFDKFEIDTGNDIQEWSDPSKAQGIKGFYVGGRESILTLDPTTKLLATDPVYTNWVAGTPGAVNIALATSVPVTLSAPQAQIIAVGKGDRNRSRIDEKQFLLETATPLVGNDSFELLQGAKS